MKQQTIFSETHKKLQSGLYDVAVMMQQANFADAQEAKPSIASLEQIMDAFERYSDIIGSAVMPVVKEQDLEIAESLDSDHAKLGFMEHRLKQAIKGYQSASSNANRIVFGNSLYKAFNEYIAFALYLMLKTELQIAPLMGNPSDKQENEWIQSLVKDILHEETRYMPERSVKHTTNNHEIIDWLKSVKNNAPVFVYQSMMRLAGMVLPIKRWNNIQAGLTEMAWAA